jgi:hypothetical protein
MRLLAIALVAVLAPLAVAQGKGPSPAHRAQRFSRTHHSPSSPLTSLFSPFLGDSFNPEDLSSAGDPSQTPPFLLQATRALSGPGGFAGQPDNSHESSSQPLLIELQGDHYVRITGAPIDGEALPLNAAPNNVHVNNAQPSKPGSHFTKSLAQSSANRSGPMLAGSTISGPTISGSAISGPTIAAAAASAGPRDLPAAILIFRDGHSEEVHDYTIADGSLYARGDFYTDGYWNKKIDLSALNLAATMQTNSARNVKFVLPSSPNEIITRP